MLFEKQIFRDYSPLYAAVKATEKGENMKIWKKGISWILAGSMVFGTMGSASGMHGAVKDIVKAAEKTRALTIDGNTLDTGENSSFRGLGAVTCSNSSRLLMDYKEEHRNEYWEIMNWLFNTKTGAGLSHIKIELGNDLATSSGAEPATKRSAGQKANVRRGAGFMFAHDALTINPDISVDMICRGMPAWVEQAYEKSDQQGFVRGIAGIKKQLMPLMTSGILPFPISVQIAVKGLWKRIGQSICAGLLIQKRFSVTIIVKSSLWQRTRLTQ